MRPCLLVDLARYLVKIIIAHCSRLLGDEDFGRLLVTESVFTIVLQQQSLLFQRFLLDRGEIEFLLVFKCLEAERVVITFGSRDCSRRAFDHLFVVLVKFWELVLGRLVKERHKMHIFTFFLDNGDHRVFGFLERLHEALAYYQGVVPLLHVRFVSNPDVDLVLQIQNEGIICIKIRCQQWTFENRCGFEPTCFVGNLEELVLECLAAILILHLAKSLGLHQVDGLSELQLSTFYQLIELGENILAAHKS